MTRRGDATRERLLDVAERLYADRGVDGVSLREIRLDAGQRNVSALQFHFGDREGLLRAIADRHLPRMDALQEEIRDRTEAAGGDPVRGRVAVLVRPAGEYLRRGPSERAWVQLSAQLAARPGLTEEDFASSMSPVAMENAAALYEAVVAVVPPEVAVERLFAVGIANLHLCADRARLEDSSDPHRTLLPVDAFVDNLVDMAHAALLAPVGGT